MAPKPPTALDGQRALRGHLVDRAVAARERYGPVFSYSTMLELLADPEFVRYPTAVEFVSAPLRVGEFAYAELCGAEASDGFRLYVHPFYRSQTEVLPALIAYHIVTINYGDIVAHEEAELFGATLLGLGVEEYYEQLCTLADAIPG